MVFQLLKLNIEVQDEAFNAIYPDAIRKLSKRHWTPVEVAKMAAEFLAERPGTRVLDIGSGAGKFCMVGASVTRGHFTGVEQRKNLVNFCEKTARVHHLKNVNYIHANITSIDFSAFDAFYFYNSFRENVDHTALIDDTVETGAHLMDVYTRYVYEQLSKCKPGTRLATYWTPVTDIPSNYAHVGNGFNGLLHLFEKIR